MATSVTTQDGALDRGARIVADARNELRGELSSLRNALSGIGGQWVGQGSTSFQAAMSRWDTDATTIIDALNGFEANLRSSSSTYSSTDETQRASFASFSARLG